MMDVTKLKLNEILPLTCSRTGTCCHGKQVWLNPWELYCLSAEKGVPVQVFEERYTDFGGIRLKFDGHPGWKNLPACSQYLPGNGCSVHPGRPLSCRLYPLGRHIQSGTVQYIYQGKLFPCLEGCPEVQSLPAISVEEYLSGQKVENFEVAQDGYLEVMQQLADIAFMLFLDTGLAKSGDQKTLPLWKKMGQESPQGLTERIGKNWMKALMLPEIPGLNDPAVFIQQHMVLLEEKAQIEFGSFSHPEDLHKAAGLMMGVALQLARALGADPRSLSELWIETARNNK